jgi:hypothetical protein
MRIKKVMSFRNAWEILTTNHQTELNEITEALPAFFDQYIVTKDVNRFTLMREVWNTILSEKGWSVPERISTIGGQRINMANIGPAKNMVSAFVSVGHIDILNRWLFQQTTIASKFEISKIPILIVPTNEFAKNQPERFFSYATFESHLNQIQPLTPLSHGYPFLILGVENSDSDKIDIFELEADSFVNESDIVIDRCIEFPPEFHQAGLGILSYFSTYLNEQYPDEKAKVKIEQHGKIVRLIIETNTGEKEIIEKALTDYQLVVTGNKKAEEITSNQKLILELNSELRIAKYRVETQQDLIQIQGGQINKLLSIIGDGLSAKSQIYLDFKPQISLNNTTIINNDISDILSNINELKSLIPAADSKYAILQDLQGSLEAIESENDPNEVKKSPALKKLKKFIDDVAEGNDSLSKTIKAAENGWEMFKNLAGKYNSVAQWCGLPQVPTIFTK